MYLPPEITALPAIEVNLQHDLVRDADHTSFYQHKALAWVSSWAPGLKIPFLTSLRACE